MGVGMWVRVVHLGRSTCHAISGRGDLSTGICCPLRGRDICLRQGVGLGIWFQGLGLGIGLKRLGASE